MLARVLARVLRVLARLGASLGASGSSGKASGELGSSGVLETGIAIAFGEFGSSGVLETGPTSKSMASASSSVFYIDPTVFTFSPTPHVLARLCDMQRLQQSHPFPSAPFRNYNIFGCGYDLQTEDFPDPYKWRLHPGCWDKAKLDMCVEQFGRFVKKVNHTQWCPSVKVIQKVLLAAQACRMWP